MRSSSVYVGRGPACDTTRRLIQVLQQVAGAHDHAERCVPGLQQGPEVLTAQIGGERPAGVVRPPVAVAARAVGFVRRAEAVDAGGVPRGSRQTRASDLAAMDAQIGDRSDQ